jgi:phospholipid transport system transporter-binding protein
LLGISLTLRQESCIKNEPDLAALYGMLAGELTRQSIPQLVKEQATNKLFGYQKVKRVVVDLKKVSKVDTAGLAWLLQQIEIAQANACQLTFAHLPSELIKLAKLSGVDGFLPVESSLK